MEPRDPRGRGRPFNGRRAPRRAAPLAAADWLRAAKRGGASPWAGKALREKRPRRHFVPGVRGVPGGLRARPWPRRPPQPPQEPRGARGGLVLAAVGVSRGVLQPRPRAVLLLLVVAVRGAGCLWRKKRVRAQPPGVEGILGDFGLRA